MGATLTLFLRLFSRRTHDSLVEVSEERVRLRVASRDLDRARTGQEEAAKKIRETIEDNAACECQRSEVVREYIEKEKKKSGLHEVENADNSAQK